MARSRSHRYLPVRQRSLAWRSARLTTKFLAIAVVTALVVPAAAGGVAVATILFAHLPGNLPAQKPAFEALPSAVYDANGAMIGVYREFDLTVPITPADVPQIFKDAVVAAEDRRFYSHKGVDINGVARAGYKNFQEGKTVEGGSTITQQYVKNAYLSGERTVSRKLREAVLATQLERRMTKEEILFNYLNTVYFGAGTYGAGAAAASYFGKPLKDLTVSESAVLAGLIPAPTDFSPRVSPTESEIRRVLVLDAMFEQGLISQAQFDEARPAKVWLLSDGPAPSQAATLVLPPPLKGAIAYPYFVDWVEQALLTQIGPEKLYRGGLRIETSIIPDLQTKAEAAVARRLEGVEPGVEMALSAVEPTTGLVRAMVSGRDYAVSQVNLATGGSLGFQPGSSFKTFVLAAGLASGRINPETVYDAPGRYRVPNCDGEGCFVYNYDGGSTAYGKVTLRKATALSLNTVYAQLILDVGIQRTAELAEKMGISRINAKEEFGVSLALGAYETSPLEMAGAYGTFANLGVHQEPTGIVRVFDKNGRLMIDNGARPGTRVLPVGVATTVTDVLKGVIATGGTGTAAKLGIRPVAGKTGTAEEYRAAWFVGYTPQLATAVWMGYRDRQASLYGINGVSQVTGGSHPTVAWADFTRAALEGQPIVDFPPPGPLPRPDGFAPEERPSVVGPEAPRKIDTSIGAARPSPVLETPNDCGGPCTLNG